MSSSCSHKIIKLRERNRILLDQLESNSILLEHRLKKLKHIARTAKRSHKSRKDLPLSPSKRKYKSWKTRNYSGQISAALNATVYDFSSNSSDTQEMNAKYLQRKEDITSPARHSKQIAQTVSRLGSREIHFRKSSQSPHKSSTVTDVTNSRKGFEDSYSKRFAGKDRMHSHVTPQESEGSTSSPDTGSSHHKDKGASELHSAKYNVNNEIMDSEQHKRILNAAHKIINYSPRSVFLRRLKERSQALGDQITLRTSSKPCSVTPPKKPLHSCKSTVRTNSMKSMKQNPSKTNLDKFSPLKSPCSARPTLGHGSHELISGGNQECTTEQSPCSSPRRTYKDEMRLKKNGKRVCCKKHCYCHVQQNIQSRKKFPSDTKENAEEKLTKKGLTSTRTSSCGYHSDGTTQEMVPPNTALIVNNTAGSLRDTEFDKKHTQFQCCCGHGVRWFDELNKFRQSQWFDCHAHLHPSCTSIDSDRNLDREIGHKCVHEHVLDKWFARPSHSDHQNKSCCMVCHLPYKMSESRIKESPRITPSSTQQDPEIQVSVPVGSSRGRRPSFRGSVLSHKEKMHRSGRGREASSPRSKLRPSHFMHTVRDVKPRGPPPANSLALRYQKGVAK